MAGESQRRLSGTHITIIVVAICMAVVAAPIGALAANGQLVNITDPTDAARKARVSGKASLFTSLRDQATGANARVNSSGHQLVNVTNPTKVVKAIPVAPVTPISNGLGNGLTVPAGKRLVVESVSASITVSAGGTMAAYIRYTTGGQSAHIFLPVTKTATFGGYDYYIAALPLKFYADPGTPVYAEATAASGSLGGSAFLTVNGYLVSG